jgi:hypothetical protein
MVVGVGNGDYAVAAQQATVGAVVAAVRGAVEALPAEGGGAPPTAAQVRCAGGAFAPLQPCRSLSNPEANRLGCVIFA